MKYAVFPPMELSVILKELGIVVILSLAEIDCIIGNLLQTDTADSACLCPEIRAQQALTQSYALEYFCATIASDCRDSHLRHYLEETFFHGFDVV